MKIFFSVVLFLLVGSATPSAAQSSVWEEPKKLASTAKKQSAKVTSTYQKWKKHLQEWGLDSSYNHSVSIGARLNTNGWTGTLIYQKPVGSIYERKRGRHAGQSQYFQLSFSEVKHEKEIKQQKENTAFPELGPSSPFIFGKINQLYLLQLGYGREQLILPGVLEGNISVSFRYGGGFSLAMLKPYYLKLINVEYTPDQVVSVQEEKYSSENAELFLKRDNILGASKWSKGVGDIKYVPGAFLEGAFVIVPSKNKTFIQQITLGGQVSVYTRRLTIMAERKSQSFQGALFVGLSLGKRWR